MTDKERRKGLLKSVQALLNEVQSCLAAASTLMPTVSVDEVAVYKSIKKQQGVLILTQTNLSKLKP